MPAVPVLCTPALPRGRPSSQAEPASPTRPQAHPQDARGRRGLAQARTPRPNVRSPQAPQTNMGRVQRRSAHPSHR